MANVLANNCLFTHPADTEQAQYSLSFLALFCLHQLLQKLADTCAAMFTSLSLALSARGVQWVNPNFFCRKQLLTENKVDESGVAGQKTQTVIAKKKSHGYNNEKAKRG